MLQADNIGGQGDNFRLAVPALHRLHRGIGAPFMNGRNNAQHGRLTQPMIVAQIAPLAALTVGTMTGLAHAVKQPVALSDPRRVA